MMMFRKVLVIAAALAAVTVGAGCASFSQAVKDNEAVSMLAVRQATMRVIEAKDGEERIARAQRIADIAREAKVFIDLNHVTIEQLQAAVENRIAGLNLAPADADLASALVVIAVAELKKRLGDGGPGVIDPDSALTVNQLLGWVITAAQRYGAT